MRIFDGIRWLVIDLCVRQANLEMSVSESQSNSACRLQCSNSQRKMSESLDTVVNKFIKPHTQRRRNATEDKSRDIVVRAC